MQAAMIKKYGEDVGIQNIAAPIIGPTDVLVKVVAASINPVDLKTKDGKVKMLLNYQMPLQLGSDFAGVIEKIGSEVNDFHVGDQVYGRVQKKRIGTWAEYLAVSQADIALKPANLTFAEAASLPLVSLTSLQALQDIMKIQPGQKVLIQAGSGGIGTVAIQLAKNLGAYVATTTSRKNFELVRNLGADQIIDYHAENFWEVLADYDFVFDTLGGANLARAFEIIKPGGKVVSISGLPDEKFGIAYGAPWWKRKAFALASHKITKLAKQTGSHYNFLFMQPSGQQLAEITKFVQAGKLQPVIDCVVHFAEIQQAIDHSYSGRARGKIILAMDESLVHSR